MKSTVQGRLRRGHSMDEFEAFMQQVRDTFNLNYLVRREIQTTDATATILWSETMPTSCAWHLETRIIGYDTANDDMAGYHEIRRYHRGTSGAPTLSSNASVVVDFEDVAGWTYAFATTTAGVITLSVTGAVATTVDWAAIITGFQIPRNRGAA